MKSLGFCCYCGVRLRPSKLLMRDYNGDDSCYKCSKAIDRGFKLMLKCIDKDKCRKAQRLLFPKIEINDLGE